MIVRGDYVDERDSADLVDSALLAKWPTDRTRHCPTAYGSVPLQTINMARTKAEHRLIVSVG